MKTRNLIALTTGSVALFAAGSVSAATLVGPIPWTFSYNQQTVSGTLVKGPGGPYVSLATVNQLLQTTSTTDGAKKNTTFTAKASAPPPNGYPLALHLTPLTQTAGTSLSQKVTSNWVAGHYAAFDAQLWLNGKPSELNNEALKVKITHAGGSHSFVGLWTFGSYALPNYNGRWGNEWWRPLVISSPKDGASYLIPSWVFDIPHRLTVPIRLVVNQPGTYTLTFSDAQNSHVAPVTAKVNFIVN